MLKRLGAASRDGGGVVNRPPSPLTMLLSRHTRRQIIALVGGASAAWPFIALAQPAKKVLRMGWLSTGPQSRGFDAFKQGLAEFGYVEGTHVVIEFRHAGSKVERFPALAQELVGLNLDLIVATNSLAARAVKQATRTIPIVVPVMGDPVGDGLVASVAHPAGNITGLTFLGPELLPKRLALLKEAVPAASLVAAIWHPDAYGTSTMDEMLARAEAAARNLNVVLQLIAVRRLHEFDPAFSEVVTRRADAVLVFPSPMLFTELRRVADFATQQRLPAMAMGREFAEFGGLMAYGANLTDLHRRAATYVDKIVNGARPGELPVEQPIRFEFIVNLRTRRRSAWKFRPTLSLAPTR